MTNRHITIHTDGSCLGNPGPGGHAAVVRCYEGEKEIKKCVVKGYAFDTTNNRLEHEATIAGLWQIRRDETCPIIIYSCNEYLIKGMTEWLPIWQANNWRTAKGKPVQNRDLWEALAAAIEGLDIQWIWVKGHNDDPRNEEANRIAQSEAKRAQKKSRGQ